jgi:uncharacterized protein
MGILYTPWGISATPAFRWVSAGYSGVGISLEWVNRVATAWVALAKGISRMTVDWNHFTPWSALVGGLLLGLASALFILLGGRILGISSIVGDLLRAPRSDRAWRFAFLAGLVAAPWVYAQFQALPPVRIDADWATLIVAGLLVGVGTRYGAGCTSGHGVCGLSRLSTRSLAATLSFMGTGFATVFVVRHVLA